MLCTHKTIGLINFEVGLQYSREENEIRSHLHLIQKIKSSQLGYILNYVMEPRGKKSKVRIHSCTKQKQSRGFCGLVAWFALTKETPLPYFIFHTGALFSSLRLKYIDQYQWSSAVALRHLHFCSFTFG